MNCCAVCGSNTQTLSVYINAKTLKTDYICTNCQVSMQIGKKSELTELDDMISQYEALAKRYESLISTSSDLPEANDVFSYTPLTMYKSIQSALALIKTYRIELIARSETKARLEYELKKSVEEEDFERSSEIRKRLDELSE